MKSNFTNVPLKIIPQRMVYFHENICPCPVDLTMLIEMLDMLNDLTFCVPEYWPPNIEKIFGKQISGLPMGTSYSPTIVHLLISSYMIELRQGIKRRRFPFSFLCNIADDFLFLCPLNKVHDCVRTLKFRMFPPEMKIIVKIPNLNDLDEIYSPVEFTDFSISVSPLEFLYSATTKLRNKSPELMFTAKTTTPSAVPQRNSFVPVRSSFGTCVARRKNLVRHNSTLNSFKLQSLEQRESLMSSNYSSGFVRAVEKRVQYSEDRFALLQRKSPSEKKRASKNDTL